MKHRNSRLLIRFIADKNVPKELKELKQKMERGSEIEAISPQKKKERKITTFI